MEDGRQAKDIFFWRVKNCFLLFGLCGDLEGSLAACLFREKMPKPLVPYLERLCGRIHVKLEKS